MTTLHPRLQTLVQNHLHPSQAAELHEFLDALDHEYRQSGQSSEDDRASSRQHVESQKQIKSAFMAGLNHQLRTELNAIQGMSELLKETRPDATQLDIANTITHSCGKLLKILHSALEFSRIEMGNLNLDREKYDFRTLALDTIRELKPLYEGRPLIIQHAIDDRLPEFLLGDPARVKQVLTSLLNNAIEYTRHGTIWFRAKIEDQAQGKMLVVSIYNPGEKRNPDGEAILEKDHAMANPEFTGTAFELALANELCTAMGGKLTATAHPSVGTTYSIALPAMVVQSCSLEEAIDLQPNPEIQEAQLEGCEILIVEDNPVNVKVAETLLEKLGTHADIASNGVEALLKLGKKNYEIVLMDCQMPEMDGFETTRQIRRLPNSAKDTPIIALTANTLDNDMQRCAEAGMSDYLSKPVRKSDLQSALARWRGKYHQGYNPMQAPETLQQQA